MIAYNKNIRSRKLFLILAFLLLDIHSISNYIYSVHHDISNSMSQNVHWLYDQSSGKCISPFGGLDECSELNLFYWKTVSTNSNQILSTDDSQISKNFNLIYYLSHLYTSSSSIFKLSSKLNIGDDSINQSTEDGILVALGTSNANSLCLGRDRWKDKYDIIEFILKFFIYFCVNIDYRW